MDALDYAIMITITLWLLVFMLSWIIVSALRALWRRYDIFGFFRRHKVLMWWLGLLAMWIVVSREYGFYTIQCNIFFAPWLLLTMWKIREYTGWFD